MVLQLPSGVFLTMEVVVAVTPSERQMQTGPPPLKLCFSTGKAHTVTGEDARVVQSWMDSRAYSLPAAPAKTDERRRRCRKTLT